MPRIRLFQACFALACMSAAMFPRIGFAEAPDVGDSCSTAGINVMSGGPEEPDGEWIVCDGANYQPILEYTSTGRSLANVGNDTGTCTTAKTGRLRYDEGSDEWEYCDGSAWNPFEQAAGGGGCTAPASCPNVGDLCTDGSLFAGFIAGDNGSCRVIFVTDDNQSTSSNWKNSTGTDDISVDDNRNGQVNAANRSGAIGDFESFDLCESNTYHSNSDWYLPARDELHLLWENRDAIDANASGAFTTSDYWSSTEADSSYAWQQDFGVGDVNGGLKTANRDVRCVRSEASPSAAGGCTAPASCPNIGDVCTDGSLFAGFMVYGTSCEALYVTDSKQSASSSWRIGAGGNHISPDDDVDGRANATNRIGGSFPAFDACENTYHGKSDWYLPARAELDLLALNQDAINANSSDNLIGDYWSSTEYNNSNAYSLLFSNSSINTNPKTDNYNVRCVRRD